MNSNGIIKAFIGEKSNFGTVSIDGADYDLEVGGITLGTLCRIATVAPSINDLKNELLDDLPSLYLRHYSAIAKAASLLCDNTKEGPCKELEPAIMEQKTVKELAGMITTGADDADVSDLYNHFKFKPGTNKSDYPGKNTPWSAIVNFAIMTKGWTEEAIVWKISFKNMLMYSFCYPSYDSADNPPQKEAVDMFSYFENMSTK